MTKALQVEPDIGLREILEISQSERYSVQYSPFLKGPGGQLGGTVLKRAAQHPSRNEDESWSDYTSRLEDAGYSSDYIGALEEARSRGREYEGVNGVVAATIDGSPRILNHAAFEAAKEGDKSVEKIATGQSADQVREALQAKGHQAYLPSVY